MSIKINIVPNKIGHLHLYPVSQTVARRVAKTNHYNGLSDCYLQCEESINEVIKSLSYEQQININSGFPVVILMDEWTYRHGFVGGQSE